MGTYYIPRNYRGESRILYIFTVKSLISTAIGGMIGFLLYLFFNLLMLKTVGVVVMAIFALVGFAVGAIKIPELGGIAFTKKVGGEPLSEIIVRYFKFRRNKKIYVYTKEEK